MNTTMLDEVKKAYEQSKESYQKLESIVQTIYNEFNERYTIEKLKSLSGLALLNTIFLNNDYNNLCYFLEFNRNCQALIGGIGGGSSAKYGLYFSPKQNSWCQGKGKSIKKLSIDEAIVEGTKIRDFLIDLCEFIEKHIQNNDKNIYKNLDERYTLNQWQIKYLHLMYPHYFPNYFSNAMLGNILGKYGYNANLGHFEKMEKVVEIAKSLEISNPIFAKITAELFPDLNVESNQIEIKLKELIHWYIQYKQTSSYNEDYKFKFFNENKHIFDTLDNLPVKISGLKAGNLLPFCWKQGFFKHIATKYSEEFKNELHSLFNANKSLKVRIDTFKAQMIELLEKDEEWKNKDKIKNSLGCEDISLFLALKDYDSYLLFNRVKPFKSFAKRLGLSIHRLKDPFRYESFQNFAQDTIIPIMNEITQKDDNSLLDVQDLIWCQDSNTEPKTDAQENVKMPTNTNQKEITIPLNQILYGPPGTGKTYSTVIESIKILDKEAYNIYSSLAGKDKIDYYDNILFPKFNEFKKEKRIEFVTFHQSYAYEEFVEGIKPQTTDNDTLQYEVVPGIFKQICERALSPEELNQNLAIRPNAAIWKVSLGGTYENDIRYDCMKNERIRIGWDAYGENYTDIVSDGKRPLDAFYNKMQIGDIIFSCYTSREIDAIGVVIGDAYWDDSVSEYKRIRKVKWLVKDIKEDIYGLNSDTVMTLSTVYRLNNISLSDVLALLKKYGHSFTNQKNEKKPYVLIIDEINRGNISKIFGELITLIEKDKRETFYVKLPYSNNQKDFTVPKNLYILGTMNTSDRSIASIDLALRRRFSFIPRMPQGDLVPETIEGVKLRDIFNHINRRITILLDRNHQIGHSYFMNITNFDELKDVWANKIMPLLNEYFYEDWEKLRLILGTEFIQSEIVDADLKDEFGDHSWYHFSENTNCWTIDTFNNLLNSVK